MADATRTETPEELLQERLSDWGRPDTLLKVTPTQCLACRHLRSRAAWTCDAFPGGIAAPILLGKHDHREPFPGDGGVTWEPKGGTG
jgi:hypothetical protein